MRPVIRSNWASIWESESTDVPGGGYVARALTAPDSTQHKPEPVPVFAVIIVNDSYFSMTYDLSPDRDACLEGTSQGLIGKTMTDWGARKPKGFGYPEPVVLLVDRPLTIVPAAADCGASVGPGEDY